jgi:PAS domain S-box-containing protein
MRSVRATAVPEPTREAPEVTLDELRLARERLEQAAEEVRVREEDLRAQRLRLEEQQWRFQQLFDLAPVAYVVTDAHGLIRQTNRAAAVMLGRSQAALAGKPLAMFVSPDERPAFRTGLSRLMRDAGSAQDWPARLVSHEDEPRDVTLTVTVVTDQVRNSTELYWIIRNATDQPSGDLL